MGRQNWIVENTTVGDIFSKYRNFSEIKDFKPIAYFSTDG